LSKCRSPRGGFAMLSLIRDMASAIDRRWRKEDFSCYKFSDIAYEEMKQVDLLSVFEFSNLENLLADPAVRNVQIASEFSDLHLKLFDNGRFYVEILNWWDRDTAIHDHGFAGVLLQLQGRALNVEYSFIPIEKVSQNLCRGKVTLDRAFLSERGDMHSIPVGETQKHAVVHVDQPTISLIVRTHPVDEISPQLNYFAPSLMANHAAADLIVNKRAKYFRLLSEMDPDLFQEQLKTSLKEASPSEAFWLILKLHDLVLSPQNIEVIKNWKASLRNDLADDLLTAVSLRRASQYLLERVKPQVKNTDHRLTLALLATTYNRRERDLLLEEFTISDLPKRLDEISKLVSPAHAKGLAVSLKTLHEAGE
jgi:hypothetical protein